MGRDFGPIRISLLQEKKLPYHIDTTWNNSSPVDAYRQERSNTLVHPLDDEYEASRYLESIQTSTTTMSWRLPSYPVFPG